MQVCFDFVGQHSYYLGMSIQLKMIGLARKDQAKNKVRIKIFKPKFYFDWTGSTRRAYGPIGLNPLDSRSARWSYILLKRNYPTQLNYLSPNPNKSIYPTLFVFSSLLKEKWHNLPKLYSAQLLLIVPIKLF